MKPSALTHHQARPFLVVAAIWFVLGAALNSFSESGSIPLFTAFTAASLANLYLIARVSRALIEKSQSMIFWGLLKFSCLGLIALMIFEFQSASKLAVFTGIASIVVIPIVGGLWFSRLRASQTT